MRNVFELHVRCAQCGTTLSLSYAEDARETKQKGTRSTDISGGFKVEQSLFVEPCQTCLEPARKVANALKVLKGLGQ